MALLQQPTTKTSTVSTPEYLRPYYDRALSTAESAFTEPYKPYTGQLIAGMAPVENQGINSAAGLGTPGQFQSAGNLLNAAGTGVMGLTGFQPSQTTGGTFGANEAQMYMNPYTQNVTDIAKRESQGDFLRSQTDLRARTAAAGGFGGSRATLLETENQRNQDQLLSDIQTKGLESAYGNAQEQFERDRAARFTAFDRNEKSRLDAANVGLEGYNSAAQIGQGLGALGAQIGDDSRANINTQLTAGLQQREQQQLDLNNQYKQFLDERGYPADQASKMATVLSSLGSNAKVTSETSTVPSDANQILGLLAQGIGGLTTAGDGSFKAGVDGLIGGFSSIMDLFKSDGSDSNFFGDTMDKIWDWFS
jgi:hypothetical protein